MKMIKNIFGLMALSVVLTLVMTISAVSASAQSLRDGEYNYIGKISPNGTVRDATYNAIGFFNADGTVADKNGTVRGRVNRDLNIYDNGDKRIGFINVDGTVRDGESNVLGKIDRNSGKVSDANGNTIGYAHGVSMLWIAAYYFFDFFDK